MSFLESVLEQYPGPTVADHIARGLQPLRANLDGHPMVTITPLYPGLGVVVARFTYIDSGSLFSSDNGAPGWVSFSNLAFLSDVEAWLEARSRGLGRMVEMRRAMTDATLAGRNDRLGQLPRVVRRRRAEEFRRYGGALLREMRDAPTLMHVWEYLSGARQHRFFRDNAPQLIKDAATNYRAGQFKFMEATWRPIPWEPPSLEHPAAFRLAHVSEDDPTQVAYYQSVEKLARGIVTRCKPGRYLSKYHPEMDAPTIKAEVETYVAKTASALQFVENTDPDGWEWVYEHGSGFTSCMVYDREERYLDDGLYGDDHPVRAYARPGNGLRLAYLGTTGRPADGRVYARAIVRDDENGDPIGVVRTYGDSRINAELKAAGYGKTTDLIGVKLNLRYFGRLVICPYIDSGEPSVDDDCIVVVANSRTQSSSTGLLEDAGWECPQCGETHDDDDARMTDWQGLTFCSACEDDFREAIVDTYGTIDWVYEDCVVYVESDDQYYRDAGSVLEHYDIEVCSNCGNHHFADDLAHTSRGAYCGCMRSRLVELATPDPDDNTWAHQRDTKTAVLIDGTEVEIHDNTPYDDTFRDPDEAYADEDDYHEAVADELTCQLVETSAPATEATA